MKSRIALRLLFTILVVCSVVGCAGPLEEQLSATADSQEDKLHIEDVEKFFRDHVDGKGFRNSMKIDEFLGVFQQGKEAHVYYRWSGVESLIGGQVNNAIHSDRCLRFNDGRWFCVLENSRTRFEADGFLAGSQPAAQ